MLPIQVISLLSCSVWLVRVDAGGHCGLPMLVLRSADVSPKVDGLQVIYGHDALGDAGGVSHSSLSPTVLGQNTFLVVSNLKYIF
uniref:Secreted protein n=1 Tax=Hucho hucho TaxID=62062 RepID=A0A4W5L092_9TELE